MTDKQTVKFGDICYELKLTTKDPIADGYERYIGLEHLDSGSLKIKRWGVLSEDNPSFNRIFRKGDILLGKRRPYLRKAAIASFSGVCSNDIVVLSVNKKIIKESLAQYVIHSDAFWQWAVKTSAGGLSPRTKFKDLEKFSFNLPGKLAQEKYNNLFECNSNAIEALESSLSTLYTTRKVLLEEKIDIGKWAALFKVSNRNNYPLVKLDYIAKRGSGHTPSKSYPSYWDGGIKWVSLQDSRSLDDIYLSDTSQNISELGIQNSSATVHPKGTVVVCRDASIGMAAVLDDDMAVSQHFISWTCSGKLHPLFLYYWLQRIKPVMEAIAIGSTIKTIGMVFFEKLEIPLPDFENQLKIAESLKNIDLMINKLELIKISKRNFQTSLSSDMIKGK